MKILLFKSIFTIYFIHTSTCLRGSTIQYEEIPDEDIFHFNIRHPNFYSTASSEETTTLKPRDPDLEYRLAMMECITLFQTQSTQINYTKAHFFNVWGAEDEGVQKIVAKLNSMQTFLDQKRNVLEKRSEMQISRQERSIMPLDWITIDVLGRGWKEIEKFIEGKCAEKNLTKPQEDELYPLREWLKFSDQELAIPFDEMKGHMETVWAAEKGKEYTLPPTSTTVIRPFSLH